MSPVWRLEAPRARPGSRQLLRIFKTETKRLLDDDNASTKTQPPMKTRMQAGPQPSGASRRRPRRTVPSTSSISNIARPRTAETNPFLALSAYRRTDTSMNSIASSSRASPGKPVLVAVDGHAEDLEAVAWAAAEATVRRADLSILHVCRWPLYWDPLTAVYPWVDAGEVLEGARQILEAAEEQARKISPDLVVNTVHGMGDPARIIVVEGQQTCVVVLGRREENTQRRHRRRSVTRHVIARSGPPVVVVGHSAPVSRGPAAGRVMVALVPSRSASSQMPVLDAAFTAAQRRGVGVTILAPGSDVAEPIMRLYERVFDDVDVRREPLDGALGSLLQRASPSAALLVLHAPVRNCRRAPSGPTLGRLLSVVSGPMTLVRTTPRADQPSERVTTGSA